MMHPHHRRRFGRDQDGVSAILGGILLFGLLASTLVTIRVQYVPVWDHDREATLMDSMAREMTYIQTDLDRQVANQTSASITDPVSLGSPMGFSFTRGPTKAGTLTFTPGPAGSGFTLASNQMTIQERDGVSLSGLQAYTTITNGQTATGVVDLVALGLRLDNPFTAGGASSPATIRVDVVDAGSSCAGQLVVAVEGTTVTGPRNVEVRTFDGYGGACVANPAASTAVHLRDTAIGCTTCSGNPPYVFVDGLDHDLGFTAVLSKATGPFTVTFALTGSPAAQGSRIFTYDQTASGGINRIGGGGFVSNNYASSAAVGTLTLNKTNFAFPTQGYVLEYGALLLDQPGGSSMAAPPVFSATTTAAQTRLTWLVPALTGTPNQVGGSRGAIVTSTPQGARSDVSALAPNITITITTPHGPVWKTFWDTEFARIGLVAGTHFTTTSSSSSASFTLRGPLNTGANDIVVDVQTQGLLLTMRASG